MDSKVMVPVEITEEMHVAAVRTLHRCTGNDDFPRRVWRAMIAAAPKAESIYQMRQISGGAWVPTDADGETCLKRMPHWRGVFEFRTLYVAPNLALTKAEQPQAHLRETLEVIRLASCDYTTRPKASLEAVHKLATEALRAALSAPAQAQDEQEDVATNARQDRDAAEASQLQTLLVERFARVRPSYPAGLYAWAFNALTTTQVAQKPEASEWREAAATLEARGVFKGAHGLQGLADAQEFWDQQPYGTRLYYGDGIADYLHRGVLQAAIEALNTAQPADSKS